MNTPNISEYHRSVKTQNQINKQITAARLLVDNCTIELITTYRAFVCGSNGNVYEVWLQGDDQPATCTCQDFHRYGNDGLSGYQCKHIMACQMQADLEARAIEQALDFDDMDYPYNAPAVIALDQDDLDTAARVLTLIIASGKGVDADVATLKHIHQLQQAA